MKYQQRRSLVIRNDQWALLFIRSASRETLCKLEFTNRINGCKLHDELLDISVGLMVK